MKIPFWILGMVAAGAVAQTASAETLRCDWTDAARQREVPAKIYFPKTGNGPFPVIIFSHGLGGSREGYEYLGRYWSEHGYVSVHLQHKGSDDAVWRNKTQPLKDMKAATRDISNSLNRPKDVSFAIDQLEKMKDGRLDLKHIGVAGHSYGAYTALASVGQAPALTEPRISAAIPMSAPVPVRPGADLDRVYRQIKVPVFHMTGTRDDSPISDTTAAQRRLPYDHSQAGPQYLLILKDADHMTFATQRARPGHDDEKHQQFIEKASLAFWDAYLKGDGKAKAWLHDGGLAAELGGSGTFEQKRTGAAGR